ncbi:chemotaxis-specific protein-glutamate methyltransferase CheB [Rubrivivax gelatinosus]|uniref:Protein-glutamate methylesterase/protein-glutamine glutaminase n=1 Tax=Rubrivivax gelatinosus TaxID=28068 RepID=A0A4R2M862_RUBGE|nr:chemotaxis-specific protein-glutamate methyltransferase CheB [Rubrivivax gelatinosus]MBK1688833.1 chemotaxis response regulator protein-glutamate methylesterase [Rubrivivax gelatinosus]TCP02842.1 two-component system chemotaxis response regulator CheB [Rubrivivax gelatinosus]
MKKVLVVDDSALMRKLLMGVLAEGGYEVRSARNGAEAVDVVVQWQPDVVTLDINMPEMDGLTALSLIMSARPTPVVMVSSLTEKGALATFEALALGAVDFIPKPGGTISLHVDDIKSILLDKVRSASRARLGGRTPGQRMAAAAVAPRRAEPAPRRAVPPSPPVAGAPAAAAVPKPAAVPGLVLIGVSTGGPRTLEDILPKLPADFAWPVLVAQHMPANFTDTFARRMDGLCAMKVVEAAAPMPLQAGTVYIGRGGTDLTVSDRGGVLYAAPRPESPGVLWHPSVEVLVNSALQHLPASRLVGVMLTGMGNDGAAAMGRLHAEGGRTIAESADTAVVFGMPAELIERRGASLVLPCTGIAAQLRIWLT